MARAWWSLDRRVIIAVLHGDEYVKKRWGAPEPRRLVTVRKEHQDDE